MAKIKKVAHVVLGVRDLERSTRFYTEGLGMELVSHLDDETMPMAFFSFGQSDHDVAVVKIPDDQPVGSSGLAHTALEVDGGEPELRELYDRLKAYGATVEMTVDHIISKSFYFLDPDGNRLEIFSQELPAETAKQTLRDLSTVAEALRPLDLESARA